MATASHPGLARLGILELSRAGIRPPSCGIIFSFEMPFSTYTHVGTHISLQLVPLPLSREELWFPVAHFRHGSTCSDCVMNPTKGRGGGAGEGGVRGTSSCRGTWRSEELVVNSVVCVHGRGHPVCQLPCCCYNKLLQSGFKQHQLVTVQFWKSEV